MHFTCFKETCDSWLNARVFILALNPLLSVLYSCCLILRDKNVFKPEVSMRMSMLDAHLTETVIHRNCL